LETSQILRLIDALAEWGVLRIIIGGGEPLVRHDLPIVLRYALQKGLRPTLASNGVELLTMDLDLLQEACVLVQVSFDTLSDSTYQRLRGIPALDRVRKGLRRLCRAGQRVRAVTVLTRQNEPELGQLAAYFAHEGVRQWFIFVVQPAGRGAFCYHEVYPCELAKDWERLARAREEHPDLSISVWGLERADTLAIYLGPRGDLTLVDYASDKRVNLPFHPNRGASGLRESWSEVSPLAKHATLINFTSAERCALPRADRTIA
jgi:MoaA/NifB/PqqE/SkfB family radical SAM enzyme